MFGCKCFYWNSISDSFPSQPKSFSLPSQLPQWPQGQGFATGRIPFGELEVLNITKFECVWSYCPPNEKTKGATFYRPVDIPDGFFSLGHYCQPNDQPLRGYVVVARDVGHNCRGEKHLPALAKPVSYSLIWSSDNLREEIHDGYYFWLPLAPEGYRATGFVVSNDPDMPSLEAVRCVRDDLTETCETYSMILKAPFCVWSTRPCDRGMMGKGVSVGTFFCSSHLSSGGKLNIACLKNLDSTLQAMPNLDQIHALIKHYGPTVSFHPKEKYLPSSVSWFFKNGALLYKKGGRVGEAIDSNGSNLPNGGNNDGEYWIDLSDDDQSKYLKNGDIESAELYVHVKPALGGTFTDIAMWVFCPFNGPATLKLGLLNIPLGKIGQHVGDWEHFTLRVSNFSGELWSIYFSQHSGGEWVDAYDLEYTEGNKAIIYSSKCGHASFPHPGSYFQGSHVVGIRNDAGWSNLLVDSSVKYQIVAAEYLGENSVIEPSWLQFMREWGPTIEYQSKAELDKIVGALPMFIRFSVENMFDKLPLELYGEEGPTGPKEKNNWFGDERW
ncbi:Vacuolar protein sorting-associated protein [Thalictrum thalictroides]|uniref:Vacuolar protein sorting-associated protein n=1 Tax=Thalictrum thalictroides TaxID=46969 RepID=A0A7J6W1D5_THATH|nr:Vacuolar protein sorting-associated protein [Thalictrum thalictroides]